ncbi:hypothetical protein TUM17576_02070 [Enterobacter hormaechei]|nr:hypothetical protein TUM17576_02070 [Enterobacter hormaechei]
MRGNYAVEKENGSIKVHVKSEFGLIKLDIKNQNITRRQTYPNQQDRKNPPSNHQLKIHLSIL